MNTSTTNSSTKKTTGVVFPLLILMLTNIVIAVIYLFFVRGFNYTFQVNEEPMFAIPGNILMWITFGMLILLGTVPYFLFNLSNFKTDRYGLRLNYTLYYIYMLEVLMWAFFSFTLSLPIVGVIMLGIAIALGIFVTYRFMTNSITSGVILTIFELWLIYVFVLNFAYVLLK